MVLRQPLDAHNHAKELVTRARCEKSEANEETCLCVSKSYGKKKEERKQRKFLFSPITYSYEKRIEIITMMMSGKMSYEEKNSLANTFFFSSYS